MANGSTDILKNEGKVRTDLHCTHCSKGFICVIDYGLNGNHVVECPHCGHEHCRVVTDGVVTSDRWDSRAQRVDILPSSVWKSADGQRKTSTASAFLRERWRNRSDAF